MARDLSNNIPMVFSTQAPAPTAVKPVNFIPSQSSLRAILTQFRIKAIGQVGVCELLEGLESWDAEAATA